MSIGRQWEDRLRIWAEQFPKHYFRAFQELSLSWFATMEHLTLEQAMQGSYAPAPVGMRWGRKWEYGWFRTAVVIPRELAGKRVVFTLNTAPEMLVWVNGQEVGAIDKQHRYITLSRSAQAGAVYEIYAECYAGHGPRMENGGPVAWGENPVPEPPEQQICLGSSVLGVWNEELFQVAMDYLTLYSLVKKLPPKSLRAMKIYEGLQKFTYIADFELPEPALTDSVVEAGKLLKPLLACKNGSTAPEYTIFGQSHLDLAWLWPVEETVRKSARTYGNQLALMEEYGDYGFLLCEPPILEWLKEQYPNVYRRVLDRVAAGQIYPEGAIWVESDTNIPSGESLIRQFVRGKRWFRRELGVESKLAWMPDTFGFSAALPQIMEKCQVPYFATQKLIRQDPEAEPFPYNLFWWEGLDGSRVLGHAYKKNNAVFDSGDLITRWEQDRVQQQDIDGLMYPFGYGDGGGGPTREMLEMARRCADLEGAPRCRMENPRLYMDRAAQQGVENVYCGELYLSWHRGTLTSQAKTKKGIRKAEVTLKLVEYYLSQRKLHALPIEQSWLDRLEELWKLLLFNQFHDIAPGSSIARVHHRAETELTQVCEDGKRLLEEILGKATDRATVYNHLGWDRSFKGVRIPAQGCAVVDLNGQSEQLATLRYLEQEQCYELRNRHLICRVSSAGELLSVQRPGSDREYLRGVGNRFLMFKDVNGCYDAWEISSMYEQLPVALEQNARVEIAQVADGVGLLVERQLHHSAMRQTIYLANDGQRLDFITTLDWQERHKLLKVAFPVNIEAKEALHEIQFGYVKRPTHRSRQFDRDRYEVCNHRYTVLEDGGAGAAVLNDCKYGVNVLGSEIRLTLLKSPLMPDATADRGRQEFTYSFYPFSGPFQQSDVLRQATELNEPLVLGSPDAGIAEEPILLPLQKNIVVDTVKPADTVENALLVRVYEAAGMATAASFTVGKNIRKIVETDMLEENSRLLTWENTLNASFGPFEIKTLLLYL